MDISCSMSPPVPDSNIGASLRVISGKLRAPILLLLSIPDMKPLLFVHPNVNIYCSIVLLYNISTGYWSLLKSPSKVKRVLSDNTVNQPSKKRVKIAACFSGSPVSSYGSQTTSKQWLKNCGFSSNVYAVTSIFKLSLMEAMIDFPVIGSDTDRNPIRKYPYYHTKILYTHRKQKL